jgi:deazaflavin-dependent oxidoreductase (nitroreductase family)
MSGAPVALGQVALRAPAATRWLTSLHAALLLRASAGPATRWFGSRVLVLETVGRRTGARRAAPLVYLPDDDDLVVVPANGGAPRPPAWWLNLRAAGEAVAVVGDERRRVRAHVAAGADRERLWRRFAAVTPVTHYQRSAGRELPVVVLRRAVA